MMSPLGEAGTCQTTFKLNADGIDIDGGDIPSGTSFSVELTAALLVSDPALFVAVM